MTGPAAVQALRAAPRSALRGQLNASSGPFRSPTRCTLESSRTHQIATGNGSRGDAQIRKSLLTFSRPDWSLFAALSIALAIFVGLTWVDGVAGAASYREAAGLTRGAILDRHGTVLVHTLPDSLHGARAYALPGLAPVLGYRDAAGAWHGLEHQYQSLLSAQPARHDWRTFFLHLTGHAAHGGSLQTTLDARIQRVAEQSLGRHMGAVVALNPATGGVLALATQPVCAPAVLATVVGANACRRSGSHPLLDRALDLTVAPGSSFKIVTLTAALDTGSFSLDSVFSGADVYGPSPYFNGLEYGSDINRTGLSQITLAQALAFSDNFTFAHVGLTLGALTLLRYAHRYYLDRKIPFNYPVAISTVAEGQAHPDKSVVARSSFGARADRVTPLQMALIAAGVANHGLLMAPHLVEDARTASGQILWRYPVHPLDRVMRPPAAHSVATGMVFDVTSGSGWPAQINGIKVAGKTGTAASGGNHPHAWFIAFAPAYHPVVAVAVLREFSGEGFQYAAPIARKVLLAGLREAGYSGSPGKPRAP